MSASAPSRRLHARQEWSLRCPHTGAVLLKKLVWITSIEVFEDDVGLSKAFAAGIFFKKQVHVVDVLVI